METIPVKPRLLADRYRVGPLLGRGGMAEVYDGYDERLQRPVAVKVLRPEVAADPEVRDRFEVEARAAAGLSHPNAVAVFDTGEDEGTPFIVMERLPGDTLADRMAGGPVDQQWLRGVAADVLGALGAAHSAGIVHRDVKPGNILLAEDGRAKVADFGIAKVSEMAADITGTGRLVGTPAYLAPERIEGQPATPQSDLYSLGVVLYEALAGAKPFDGDTPVAVADAVLHAAFVPLAVLRPDVDPDMADAVAAAMERHPARRPASAGQMAAQLGAGPAFAADAPDATVNLVVGAGLGADPTLVGAPMVASPGPLPATRIHEARQWNRRTTKRVALAAATLLMVVVLVGLARGSEGNGEVVDKATAADIRDLASRVKVGDGPAGPMAADRLDTIADQVVAGGGATEANTLLADASGWQAGGLLSATALNNMVAVLGRIDGVDTSVVTSTIPTTAPTTLAPAEPGRVRGKHHGGKGEQD